VVDEFSIFIEFVGVTADWVMSFAFWIIDAGKN
jgi:hypothetical protein